MSEEAGRPSPRRGGALGPKLALIGAGFLGGFFVLLVATSPTGEWSPLGAPWLTEVGLLLGVAATLGAVAALGRWLGGFDRLSVLFRGAAHALERQQMRGPATSLVVHLARTGRETIAVKLMLTIAAMPLAVGGSLFAVRASTARWGARIESAECALIDASPMDGGRVRVRADCRMPDQGRRTLDVGLDRAPASAFAVEVRRGSLGVWWFRPASLAKRQ